jgi:signal peptidase I
MQTHSQGNASIELACGLAEEVVRTFGEVRLRVFGTSMVPSIFPGDLVLVHRAGLQEIFPGEVVLYLRNERFFVHRVVERKVISGEDSPGEPHLITRGDRLRRADAPVSSAELLGRVVSIERDSRKVEIAASNSNLLIARLLRSSDLMTSLYLRLAAFRPAHLMRREKCQA